MAGRRVNNGVTLGFEETLWQAAAGIVKQVVSQFGHSMDSMMRRGNPERWSQSVTTYEGKIL